MSRGPVSDRSSWYVLSSLRSWMGSTLPDPETGEIAAGEDDRATTSRREFGGTTVAWDAAHANEPNDEAPTGE